MERKVLLPTPENLIDSFLKNSIGRNESIYEFIDILNDIKGNYSLALDSDWGNGKTFFVKQTQMIIDALNPNRYKSSEYSDSDYEKILEKNPQDKLKIQTISHITTYYDAWENDNDVDPILSIVYTIISSLGLDEEKIAQTPNMLTLISSIVTLVTGKDIVGFKENIEGKDLLEKIRETKEIKKNVNDLINGLFAEHGDRIIIFIDELDRCRPDFAIELLERIKHYFTNDKITFVFSVNLNQLQHTVKKIYGNEFDGYRYLDRFFDLKISLPDTDEHKFLNCVNFKAENRVTDRVVKASIYMCNLSLREQIKFMQKVQLVQERCERNEMIGSEISHSFIVYILIPIMIALKFSDINEYEEFKKGENYNMLVELLMHPMLQEDLMYGVSSNLFNSNEISLTNNCKTIDNILVEEKAIQVYNAIFKNQNDQIGSIFINNRIRDKVKELQSII